MEMCGLHGANIANQHLKDSLFAFQVSTTNKQTQNPAAKFSTLLIHWLQNYSTYLQQHYTDFTRHNPMFKC